MCARRTVESTEVSILLETLFFPLKTTMAKKCFEGNSLLTYQESPDISDIFLISLDAQSQWMPPDQAKLQPIVCLDFYRVQTSMP